MSYYFNKAKYYNISNNITGDLYYGYDKMIEEDQSGYYRQLVDKGVFYDRNKIKSRILPVSNSEIQLLNSIKKILIKHNTSYKVVIAPCYNQVKIDNARFILLTDIFGNNVYDFSGVNKFTNSIYNYYEDSHYRPHVAIEIMEAIYSKDIH